MSDAGAYRRAMVLVTVSSLLVPVVGLVTAPVLTQALGVDGRGTAAAAVAPNLLIVGIATLGLPEALTYHIAKRPYLARRAILWATLLGSVVGCIGLLAVFFATPFLSVGDDELARLMLFGTMLALPTLFVSLLRGAATGRQMWTAVAAERVITSLLRLVVLVALALTGTLDVLNAVIVMTVAPVVAGIAYWQLLLKPPVPAALPMAPEPGSLPAQLLGFGSRVWFGTLATMLMARLSQLLVAPLSDVAQLGLLIVAVTISDVPYIVTQTVRDVVFGANSSDNDTTRLLSTSRVATLIAFAGSAVLGVSLPLWIGALFGEGFVDAMVPTWLLLASSVIAVPGLIAGAGLAAANRPGLRSAALLGALIVYVLGLLLLVPPLGALGAAIAGLASTVVSTGVGVVAARKVMATRVRDFVVPHRSDLDLLWSIVRSVLSRLGFRRDR